MPLHSINRRAGKVLAGAVLAGFLATSANAALTLNVVATNATGGASILDGGKSVLFPNGAAAAGATVTVDVVGVISGVANTPVTGINSAYFGLTSSGLDGNYTSAAVAAAFSASGSQAGTLQDVNGDGNIDVGRLDPLAASGLDWAYARAANTQAGLSHVLGTYTYVIDGLLGAPGQLQVVPRAKSAAAPALAGVAQWYEDNVVRNLGFGAGGAGAVLPVGEPVTISVIPEPASLGLVALGGLAALARRRRA